jgi:hypothetical protein
MLPVQCLQIIVVREPAPALDVGDSPCREREGRVQGERLLVVALREGPRILGEGGLALEEFAERGERHSPQPLHRLEQAIGPRGRGANDAECEGVPQPGEIALGPTNLSQGLSGSGRVVKSHPDAQHPSGSACDQAVCRPASVQRTRRRHGVRARPHASPPFVDLEAGRETEPRDVRELELDQVGDAAPERIERLGAIDLQREQRQLARHERRGLSTIPDPNPPRAEEGHSTGRADDRRPGYSPATGSQQRLAKVCRGAEVPGRVGAERPPQHSS